MAILFDAFSESAGSTGTQTAAHSPVGTPKAVIAWTLQLNQVDEISTCTYGGEAMTEIATNSTAGESAFMHCFFLGAGVPDGPQNCVATASATTGIKVLYCVTVTAAGDVEVVDSDATIAGTAANPSVTLSLGGRSSFAALCFWSGVDDPAAASPGGVQPLTNWTSLSEEDAGSESGGVYIYDIVSTADVTAGWAQASD